MSKLYISWQQIILIGSVAVGGLFISCEKGAATKKDVDQLPVRQNYDGVRFESNKEVVLPVLQQLELLMAEVEKGRRGRQVSTKTLDTLFTGGILSLQSVTTPYYANRLRAANGFFVELSKASVLHFFNPFNRNATGGIYHGYLVDENGVELEQLIEKGLYGAALYNYATSLTNGALLTATVDQLLFLLGGNPLFPNSTNPLMHQQPDRLSAGYAAQRDNGDGTGLYFRLRKSFITLQTALYQGEQFNKQRDEALAEIKLNWEKTVMATVINRLHTVIALLQSTNLADRQHQQWAESLHLLSEAAGLLHGWRMIDSRHRKITDKQIDDMLVLLHMPVDDTSALYRFVTSISSELPRLNQVIGKLQAIYGFTNQEVADFKMDWVNEQKR